MFNNPPPEKDGAEVLYWVLFPIAAIVVIAVLIGQVIILVSPLFFLFFAWGKSLKWWGVAAALGVATWFMGGGDLFGLAHELEVENKGGISGIIAKTWAYFSLILAPLVLMFFVDLEDSQGNTFAVVDAITRKHTPALEPIPDPAPFGADLGDTSPPVDDAEFSYDASSFEGAGDSASNDEKLWSMARDPRTPEGERQNAMRLLEKRASPKQITHRRK